MWLVIGNAARKSKANLGHAIHHVTGKGALLENFQTSTKLQQVFDVRLQHWRELSALKTMITPSVVGKLPSMDRLCTELKGAVKIGICTE